MIGLNRSAGSGEAEQRNLATNRWKIGRSGSGPTAAGQSGQNHRRPDEPGGGYCEAVIRSWSQKAGPRLIIQYPFTPGRCRGKA